MNIVKVLEAIREAVSSVAFGCIVWWFILLLLVLIDPPAIPWYLALSGVAALLIQSRL